MINVIVKMRDTGMIVRQDSMPEENLSSHLTFLDYYYGMDMDGLLDKKRMTINFFVREHQGTADIIVEPVG